MDETKDFDGVEEIECPHCGTNQSFESGESGGLITFWRECHECKKPFWIREVVSRYWGVAKNEDGF